MNIHIYVYVLGTGEGGVGNGTRGQHAAPLLRALCQGKFAFLQLRTCQGRDRPREKRGKGWWGRSERERDGWMEGKRQHNLMRACVRACVRVRVRVRACWSVRARACAAVEGFLILRISLGV